MINKELIRTVGFDLDGTLYESTRDIDERVRDSIARRILDINPNLRNFEEARRYFDREYTQTQSGKGVLEKAGYQDARRVMESCLAEAEILDLIKRDEKLSKILENLSRLFPLYLLTNSPGDLAIKKLEAIGINPEVFSYVAFSDTPGRGDKSTGEAYRFMINRTGIQGENHLYVGDRAKQDIIPAKQNGIQTIGVWSYIPQADLCIKNINDIGGVLL